MFEFLYIYFYIVYINQNKQLNYDTERNLETDCTEFVLFGY